MMYKKILLLILTLFISNIVFAKDIAVKVTPANRITTSDSSLKEGDNIIFVVDKDVFVGSKLYFRKGERVTGLVTSLIDNGFNCQEASIYAENFHLKNTDNQNVNLSGIIYKKGHDHTLLTQFVFFLYPLTRGGEVQMLPDKDVFTLYLDENL